ncbi:sigma-54 interaction domain-containing protein [Pueribacillus theae]|uniref:sigma-54 interaction domain-containing protein n=1 Tax=Pueribacillus theae TaxID=2171751 RepID=UPI0014033CC2|nr:sigma 54-interacting transcriptional regulator [Pueribacillus theae]
MDESKKTFWDWGFFEIDTNGRLIHVSQQLCEHFNLESSQLTHFNQMLKETSLQKIGIAANSEAIVFGVLNNIPCLLKVFLCSQKGFICQVILKYEESYRQELLSLLNNNEQQKRRKVKRKQRPLSHSYTFEQINGTSSAIEQIKELAARVSRGSSTVLLTGESGTGKELFAQAIHDLSPRREGPFIPINCASIPESLFESELFGYEAGAFSGAGKDGKPGKIELAQNGTLFLDEISELPFITQGKFLRVLQEREIERLGGTGRKRVDIRIIAATNRDLMTLVQEGKFRQDLFYRLLVFELKIPPLRDRKEDILLLADQFIDDFNDEFGLNVKEIDPLLKDWMLNYDWPGNVRELKSFIERGMNIVEGGTLTLDDFFLPYANFPIYQKPQMKELLSLEEEVTNAEISAIERALEETNGDKTLAAEKLNIHLASLYRKMSKYNLK